ncbi:DNRLRE domain-containing protein [Candidatus Woesearchaeota archaeon]|nr:DNRLRE domain-containing protein [Candidatus Woesearchaeota archaeon]
MRVIELSIYILTAVLVGSLLFHFTLYQTKVTSETVEELLDDDERPLAYTKVEMMAGFLGFWEGCASGLVNKTYALYLNGTGTLTKQELVDYLDGHELLTKLPRNNIVMTEQTLPKIVQVACQDGRIFLSDGIDLVVLKQDTRYVDCFVNDEDFLECGRPNEKVGYTNVTIGKFDGRNLIQTTQIQVHVVPSVQLQLEVARIDSAQVSTNLGNEAVMPVGSSSPVLFQARGLPSIPADRLVQAELVLAPISGTSDITVHALRKEFLESTVTWDSHNGAYFPGVVANENINSTEISAINVTPAVQGWLSDPDMAHGFYVRFASPMTLPSDEHQDVRLRPTLSLLYR